MKPDPRLDRLETQVRWLKLLLAGTIVTVAIFLIAGYRNQELENVRADLVTASALQLVGPDSSMLMAVSDELFIFDSALRTRIHLSLDPHGQRLALVDTAGNARAVLALKPDGAPYLTLFDSNGITRAVLGATDLENVRTGTTEHLAASSLVLFDREGEVIWRIP